MAEPARSGALDAGVPPRHQLDAPQSPARHPRRATLRDSSRDALHAAVIAACVLPALQLIYRFVTDDLGGEPIDAFEKATGTWALRFLAAALAVTPLRKLTGWGALARYRRSMGLVAFTYATIHMLAYAVLDLVLDVSDIVEDIVKHPYVTLGMASWLMLLSLALTSTKGWQKRLGGRRWRNLHRLVFVVAVTASVHFLWSVKKDRTRPLVYAAIIGTLLIARPLLTRRRSTPDA